MCPPLSGAAPRLEGCPPLSSARGSLDGVAFCSALYIPSVVALEREEQHVVLEARRVLEGKLWKQLLAQDLEPPPR